MRGPTNYLLALTAFFEILHQTAHFLFLAVSVSGINFINYSTALIFQLHSIFGGLAAQSASVSIAADRLLSILIPIKHKNLKIRPYLFAHTLLAIAIGFWMAIYSVNFANKYPTLPVTGYLGDLFVLEMLFVTEIVVLFEGLNAVIYVVIWIVICCFHSGKIKQKLHFFVIDNKIPSKPVISTLRI